MQVSSTVSYPTNLESASMTYEESLAWIFRDVRFSGRGRKYDNPERSLARMREILDRLGNPQQRFHALHITGTKGKGSTSAYAESILRHLGYRTGLFTSPHLHSFRERIRVNGQLISRDDLAALVSRVRDKMDAVEDLGVFDRITALAFQHFADAGVEFAVVEVGLGGRLDSTNVLLPAVCAITCISMDHMHILGDTIAQIAREKAGIIKTGVPIFSAPQQQEAAQVLADRAAALGAPLRVVQPLHSAAVPLLGTHQQINAALAWEMTANLAERGLIQIDGDGVELGLAATRWPGRFEMLPLANEAPFPLLVDCAHNVDSVTLLLATLEQFYPGRPITFIFGANRDKELAPEMELILRSTQRVVLVQSQHPKATLLADLAVQFGQIVVRQTAPEQIQVAAAPTMTGAIEAANALTPPGGLIVGSGSVFVAAELREAWNTLHPGLFPADDWVHAAAGEPVLVPPPPLAPAGG
ncbi:MAG: bifunctional folylpolyglutamate synthase/dihydrofolate synthase [Chloroflexi bacterium]|nr:bifunctional folylpolyglutamate synthase/dihydrofolate synthase [Chloroflexota bacterium]